MRIKRFALALGAAVLLLLPFLALGVLAVCDFSPGHSVANIVGWCNGSIRGSEPRDGGSNPSPATNVVHHVQII